MIEEFIRLFLGGFPVVPGHCHMDVVRDDRPFRVFDPGKDLVGNGYRIGPLSFGYGQGDCRGNPVPGRCMCFFNCRTSAVKDILRRLRGSVMYRGNVSQIDRSAVKDTDNHPAYVFSVFQKTAGMDLYPALG